MPDVMLKDEPFTVAEGYDNFWRKATAGRWEPSTFDVIDRCVDGETVVLDIGAWVGPTVLYEARRAKRVSAFEPDPASAAMLRRNVSLNADITEKVTIHENAVWTEAGPRRMGNPHAQGDSMSSLLDEGAAHAWTVECMAVADVCAMVGAEEKLFVKLDVEGAEYEILPALMALFDRPRVAALVAFHPHMMARGWQRVRQAPRRTRDAFAAFEGLDVRRVTRRHVRPAIGAQWARSTGQWLFEARDNYLFSRGV